MNFKNISIALWDIIDEIDTFSDMAKDNDKLYRKLVAEAVVKRFQYLTSEDGYCLIDPKTKEVVAEAE